ncbi:translin family [Nitzschia inconspicua]|uniref:Translin family n=1 Tax=Nitzschia inconspicua TaxID=303405 RepID=A0A9K3PLT2_9STRA|nr:translin family [Nitzschia inconspicua]
MPEPPFLYCSAAAPVLDLSELGAKINDADKNRRDAYDVSREIQVKLLQIRTELETNASTAESMETNMTSLLDALIKYDSKNSDGTAVPERTPRVANLSNRYEDYCRFLAFQQFLKTGGWLSPETCFSFGATDEEYLAGACMGVCRDLERYALGRATARDVSSVQAARNLVNEILDYLMQFDFRNGPLRRKYDGTKYALKTLETLLYELSVTGATLSGDEGGTANSEEPQPKKQKIDTDRPQDLLDAIRSRMEHRDELREKLIKKCRDSQKAAKQAIYALHREDFQKAAKLIQQCEDGIQKDLFPIVNEEPPLRSGSFANVLEEYAEAKLFQVWLLGNQEGKSTPKGSLLLLEDFPVALEPEEYLGGLCDLTGEIGRFAVQCGTSRDYDGVRLCLEANSAISLAISTLERAPNGINKKMDQLRRSVEKIERMTYEMSLSKAAGININTEVTENVEKDEDGE